MRKRFVFLGIIQIISLLVGIAGCTQPAIASTPAPAPATTPTPQFPLHDIGPMVRLGINGGFPLVTIVTKKSAEEMALSPGKHAFATFKATGAYFEKGLSWQRYDCGGLALQQR